MTDRALIKAAQAGDRQAFARLLDGEYARIFRISMQWCGHRADAEDITQLACIKLAKSVHQFRFESSFQTWLYRLVINCARDWQQSQARHQQQRVHAEDGEPPLEAQQPVRDGVDAEIDLHKLLRWTSTLGDGFHETLLLVFGQGLTHAEAAVVLNIKESTVSWRIHEIRKRLIDWYRQSGGEA